MRLVLPRFSRARELMVLLRHGITIPKLKWEKCAPCPEKRAEAAGVKVGRDVYIIGGYQTIDDVLSIVDVFDLDSQRWTARIPMPPDVPQTHAAIATDGKQFVYMAGGQLGPRCRPAVNDCFVLNVAAGSWSRFPSLPEPRYAPVMRLWHGRLHVLSGALADRWTSALDHWSIGVSEGASTEHEWRTEEPIPKGGPHRATAICNGALCLLGGQDGDIKPRAGDSLYQCDPTTPLETVYGDSFIKRSQTDQWHALPAMPQPQTHCEGIATRHYVIIVGGNEGRHRLAELIQVYDGHANRWRKAARLPYRMKTSAVYHEGWLYLITGQRSKSLLNPAPGEVSNFVWRAKFDPR